MLIAIDGPAAAGKGTLAKQISQHFGLHYLDTGSLYRAVGLKVVKLGGDIANKSDALKAAKLVGNSDLSDNALRTAVAGENASIVAQMPEVRQEMLEFQRRFARKSPGAVLDGRDIGTVVCPNADIKLFVTASSKERARRRHVELVARNEPISYETVLAELAQRDKRDSERLASPLKPAQDAHLLDTSKLDIEAAFQAAVEIIDSL